MKDRGGNIIYVGKSKNLKSRVKSYFYGDHNQQKIKQMVSRVHDIDIIPTDTHLEARVLECELIKRLKPLYNRQFKNDRGYVYLRIGDDSRSKPIAIVDEKTDDNCIGPYRSREQASKGGGDALQFVSCNQMRFPVLLPIQRTASSYEGRATLIGTGSVFWRYSLPGSAWMHS